MSSNRPWGGGLCFAFLFLREERYEKLTPGSLFVHAPLTRKQSSSGLLLLGQAVQDVWNGTDDAAPNCEHDHVLLQFLGGLGLRRKPLLHKHPFSSSSFS